MSIHIQLLRSARGTHPYMSECVSRQKQCMMQVRRVGTGWYLALVISYTINLALLCRARVMMRVRDDNELHCGRVHCTDSHVTPTCFHGRTIQTQCRKIRRITGSHHGREHLIVMQSNPSLLRPQTQREKTNPTTSPLVPPICLAYSRCCRALSVIVHCPNPLCGWHQHVAQYCCACASVLYIVCQQVYVCVYVCVWFMSVHICRETTI